MVKFIIPFFAFFAGIFGVGNAQTHRDGTLHSAGTLVTGGATACG